jgi:hypothetical protein
VYIITVTYKWGGAGAVTTDTRTFNYTLNDPCIAFVTIPSFQNFSGFLNDPNTNVNVSPTITPIQYNFCEVAISMTVTKGGLADTSGNFV